MAFFSDFKQLRTEAGLSQQALSDLTKIPLRTIENWENGYRQPAEYIQRLVLNELEVIVKNNKEDKNSEY